MEQVAPLGPAYQAGTMAGNPASMASGIACLEVLQQEGTYEKLDQLGARLEKGILEKANQANIPVTVNRRCGALTVFFSEDKVTNYADAEATDGELFGKFFKLIDRKSTRLNSSHVSISYAVFCL